MFIFEANPILKTVFWPQVYKTLHVNFYTYTISDLGKYFEGP
jgi:hypothetical protein